MPQGMLEATADLGLSEEAQAHLAKTFQIAKISFDEAQAQAAKTKERATRVAQIERGSAFLQFEALLITEWPAEHHDMLAEHIGRHASLERPVPTVDLLLAIARGFDDLKETLKPPAGRPTQAPLERATRILLPAIEKATGTRALIQWNKAKGCKPESRSPVTTALVTLLQNIDSSLQETAIFNMIEKVRTKPEMPRPHFS